MIHIDFETRSPVDLRTEGLYKYAEQAEIICMAWKIDNDPVQIWKNLEGQLFPYEVCRAIQSGMTVAAHNAEFEAAIFAECLPLYAPEPHQWLCTAVMAAACALPRGLEDAARALGIARKDPLGKELIQRMCVPPYEQTPELLEQMYKYCKQDVRVEFALQKCLRDMTPTEQQDFQVNLKINRRGLPIDRWLAEKAQAYAAEETHALIEEIRHTTNNEVQKKSGRGLTTWVYNNLPDATDMEVDGKIKFDKRIRETLLERNDIPANVRTVIECCDQASKSSVTKFKAMAMRANEDNRVRGAYVMNGGSTGRFSSTGAQLHNYPRAVIKDPEPMLDRMEEGLALPNVMTTLSHLLRPAIYAPEGRCLIWADWSAIEGRVLPWLANSEGGEDKLQLFRQGIDLYKHTYREMFHVEHVDNEQRQQGKVAELALGFAGGAGALAAMGSNFGIDFDHLEAQRIVKAWRRANDWANTFWVQLERAANKAVRDPDTPYHAGRVSYLYTPGVLNGALWCALPSGRLLCYPGARREIKVRFDEEQYVLTALKSARRPKVGEDWPRHTLWRGLLAENVTQAVAADLLRHCLRELVLERGVFVIGHTHDEIIMETQDDDDAIQCDSDLLRETMETPPAWAEGLPLNVEIGHGLRYKC